MTTKQQTNAIGKNIKKRYYALDDTITTVAFKFYGEQMPKGEEALRDVIRSLDPSCVQALMIKHDQDTVAESFWETSIEKPHYHLILRLVGTAAKGRKLRTIMKMFAGALVYRKGHDDDLLQNHGCEPCKDFSAYATYLTHDTAQAIQDGKHRYSIDAIVSNLTLEEIKQIRAGYTRVSAATHRVSMSEWIEMDEDAYQRGYELQDWDEWERQQPFVVRTNAKLKTIKRRYLQGVEARISEDDYRTRVCIYIHSDKPNLGKSFNSLMALKKIGVKKILTVAGGGTGKLDKLTISHDAIVCDDDTLPQLLNLADNKITSPYRRNSDNPHWCGRYLIVTSNLPFDEWVKNCGITEKDQIDAVRSRFFICTISEKSDTYVDFETGENKKNTKKILRLESPSKRGDREAQEQRKDLYYSFKMEFEDSLAHYNPEEISYFDISDDDYDFSAWAQHKFETLFLNRFQKLEKKGHHPFSLASLPLFEANERGGIMKRVDDDWVFVRPSQAIKPLSLFVREDVDEN